MSKLFELHVQALKREDTYRSVRAPRKHLEHTFLVGWTVFPPLGSVCDDGLEGGGREDELAREHGPALRVQLEDEFGHDAKVAAGATNAPKQIGVLLLAGDELCASCSNEGHLEIDSEKVDDRYFPSKACVSNTWTMLSMTSP
jgi:hypothetical protein